MISRSTTGCSCSMQVFQHKESVTLFSVFSSNLRFKIAFYILESHLVINVITSATAVLLFEFQCWEACLASTDSKFLHAHSSLPGAKLAAIWWSLVNWEGGSNPKVNYSSSHNHGSEKWVPRMVATVPFKYSHFSLP